MSNTLYKDGTPPVPGWPPGVPADPGSTDTPAYCIPITDLVETYQKIQVVDTVPYIWTECLRTDAGASFWFSNGESNEFSPDGIHYHKPITNPNFGRLKTVTRYTGLTKVTRTECHGAEPAHKPDTETIAPIDGIFNLGWNGSANTVERIEGDGTMSFSVASPAVGVVAGLNDQDGGGHYLDIKFGFYFEGDRYKVIESGVTKTAAATFASSDVFEVVRKAGKIRYGVNGVQVYESLATPSARAMFGDCSLYSFGDAIIDTDLSDNVDTTYALTTFTLEETLTPLTIYFSDSSTKLNVNAELFSTLASDIRVDNMALAGTIGPITFEGIMSEGDGTHFSLLNGILTPLDGFGTIDGLQPQTMIGLLELPGLTGFMWIGGGSSFDFAGVLPGMTGHFSESLTAFDLNETLFDTLGGDIWLDEHFSVGFGDAYLPSIRAFGIGQVGEPVTHNIVLPRITALGYGAAVGDITLPRITTSGSAKQTIIGLGDIVLPELEVDGTGSVGLLARGPSQPHPIRGRWIVRGYGGAAGAIELPTITVQGSGVVGRSASGASALPRITVSGSGDVGFVAIGALTLPAIAMVSTGRGSAVMPRFTAAGVASITVATTYEGYNFTFAGDRVLASHLTDFPFRKIVRFKNRYLGVADDGLYELTGDTFDGEPIVADVITGEDDFGRSELKRIPSVWINGRTGRRIAMSLIVGEDHLEEEGDVLDQDGVRNRRVKFGKGNRGRYHSVRFRNTDGDAFAIASLEPEIKVLRRMRNG